MHFMDSGFGDDEAGYAIPGLDNAVGGVCPTIAQVLNSLFYSNLSIIMLTICEISIYLQAG
jgi:hypothetical protein